MGWCLEPNERHILSTYNSSQVLYSLAENKLLELLPILQAPIILSASGKVPIRFPFIYLLQWWEIPFKQKRRNYCTLSSPYNVNNRNIFEYMPVGFAVDCEHYSYAARLFLHWGILQNIENQQKIRFNDFISEYTYTCSFPTICLYYIGISS